MDKEELQKNIALYYSKLPTNLQEIFSSMKWMETLQQIATKYGLNDAQSEILGTETTLVLLGIVHPDEYYEILKDQLNLPNDSITKILAEINDSIISDIRPQIIEVFNENNKINQSENIETGNLDEKFKNLPESIKKIIAGSNYKTVLYDIAKEYGLNVIEIGVLENDLTDLIIGSIHPNKFEGMLKNTLKFPDEKTHELANAINEKILKRIREEMEKLPNNHTFETINQTNDNQVLSRAGIEIIPTGGVVLNPTNVNKKVENNLPVPEKLEISASPTMKPTPSILAQKLSAPVQTSTVKTDHTLPNITPPSASGKPAVDPYREIPE